MTTQFTRRRFLAMSSLSAVSLAVPALTARAATQQQPVASFAARETYANAVAVVQKTVCSLGVYDFVSGKSLAQIPLPKQSHELVMTPDRRYAFIAQYGAKKWAAPGVGGNLITMVDMQKLKVVKTLDLTPWHRLHGIRMDKHGRLFVLSESSSVLIRFDNPVDKDEPDAAIPVNGVRSHYFVLNNEGSRAWITDTLSGLVIAVNTEDPSVPVQKLLAGKAPEGSCLSPDEKTIYVVDRYGDVIKAYDSETLKTRYAAKTQGESVRVAALQDGKILLANAARKSLLLFSPDLTLQKEIFLPASPTAITLTQNADQVLTSTEDDKLTLVDITSSQLLRTISTDKGADASVLFHYQG